jgi:hypothetical protein
MCLFAHRDRSPGRPRRLTPTMMHATQRARPRPRWPASHSVIARKAEPMQPPASSGRHGQRRALHHATQQHSQLLLSFDCSARDTRDPGKKVTDQPRAPPATKALRCARVPPPSDETPDAGRTCALTHSRTERSIDRA